MGYLCLIVIHGCKMSLIGPSNYYSGETGIQSHTKGFPCNSDGKESACNVGGPMVHPWVGKIPWKRAWLPTPVFLPGKYHGQRSLAGYSPWDHKELDMTERLSLGFSTH